MGSNADNNASTVDPAYLNYKRYVNLNNYSGVILINGTDDPVDPFDDGQSKDTVPIVIILGVFFSVCAVISLLVLLVVYCTQSGRWPFRRRPAEKEAVPLGALDVNGEQQALWARTAEEGGMLGDTSACPGQTGEGAVTLIMDPNCTDLSQQGQTARPASQQHPSGMRSNSTSSSSECIAAVPTTKVKTKVPALGPDEETQRSLMKEFKEKQQNCE